MTTFGKISLISLVALAATLHIKKPVHEDLPEERTLSLPETPAVVIKFEERQEGFLLIGENGPITVADGVVAKGSLPAQVTFSPEAKIPTNLGAISAIEDPDRPGHRILIAQRLPPEGMPTLNP